MEQDAGRALPQIRAASAASAANGRAEARGRGPHAARASRGQRPQGEHALLLAEAHRDLDAVGAKFAKSRNAELVKATSREVEGSLVYTLELKGELYHELLALCINRGKLYRVSAVTSNKKWDKRKELYKNIMLSFVPQGY